MDAIRFLYWLGVAGWALVLLNFLLGWVYRRTLLRLAWTLAAWAGLMLLLSRVVALSTWVRTVSDVLLAIGGATCGAGLLLRYVNNPRVIE